MNWGKCEQSSEVLFSDTKGDAPFLKMQTQKHPKRRLSYIASLKAEAKKDRKERLKRDETNEPTYLSIYEKEVKWYTEELCRKSNMYNIK